MDRVLQFLFALTIIVVTGKGSGTIPEGTVLRAGGAVVFCRDKTGIAVTQTKEARSPAV